jgi:hypothetical protein
MRCWFSKLAWKLQELVWKLQDHVLKLQYKLHMCGSKEQEKNSIPSNLNRHMHAHTCCH